MFSPALVMRASTALLIMASLTSIPAMAKSARVCDAYARDYARQASRQGQVIGGGVVGSVIGLGIGIATGGAATGAAIGGGLAPLPGSKKEQSRGSCLSRRLPGLHERPREIAFQTSYQSEEPCHALLRTRCLLSCCNCFGLDNLPGPGDRPGSGGRVFFLQGGNA